MRKPDFVIGDPSNPYMLRWWLIPRNRLLNVYLHKFCRDDDDQALHDHPWLSLSIVVRGGYYDITNGPDGTQQRRWYGPWSVIARGASSAHRVELARDPESSVVGEWRKPIAAWTLFITGPRIREWGFLCPQGWRHWREFTAGKHGEMVGKGCE